MLPNQHFNRFTPSFPQQIVGDVVFVAVNKRGVNVDMNITPSELRQLSKPYLEKAEKRQLEFFKMMADMGVKIVHK